MFAYCLNNPIIFGDFTGEDAVILLDNDAPTHIGIMAQDANGNWWHFYWGVDPNYIGWCVFGFNLPVYTWCKKYTGSITVEAINKSKQFNDYESMLRLYGDFSFSAEAMRKAVGEYNLYTNNCSQVSLRILAASDTFYSSILQKASDMIVPNDAFKYLTISPAVIIIGIVSQITSLAVESIKNCAA